jgi:hypothetical protein
MRPAVVQAQLEYRVENRTITITGYSGLGGAVTIPATIHGLPVTAIGWGTFCGWSTMTSVTIPESVTSIEGLVFSGCVRLTSIAVDPRGMQLSAAWMASCSTRTGRYSSEFRKGDPADIRQHHVSLAQLVVRQKQALAQTCGSL